MATLETLLANGLILPWRVHLSPRQQVERLLYLLPEFQPRLDQKLAGAGSTWNIEETPAQQLDTLTAIFVAGEPLAFGWQFKSLAHHRGGVWYLKTADIRLFGWFPRRDLFIAASIAIAEEIKHLRLYRGFGDEVVQLRNALPLDEPKFIGGHDPNAVVSNFTYPA